MQGSTVQRGDSRDISCMTYDTRALNGKRCNGVAFAMTSADRERGLATEGLPETSCICSMACFWSSDKLHLHGGQAPRGVV